MKYVTRLQTDIIDNYISLHKFPSLLCTSKGKYDLTTLLFLVTIL